MPPALTIASSVSVILGLGTATMIAIDITRRPQSVKVMNAVWPITGLYLPAVGWWFYAGLTGRKRMSIQMPMDGHAARRGRAFWRSVFISTTHCAAGCVLGDIIASPIVHWTGWTLLGQRIYAEFVALFVLAYIFGIAFQYLPIRAIRMISRRDALFEAIKADTLALTAFEVGLFAWMAVVYFFLVPRVEVSSPIYWLMMQIGMIVGFVASFPPNWYLVRWGVKPGM